MFPYSIKGRHKDLLTLKNIIMKAKEIDEAIWTIIKKLESVDYELFSMEDIIDEEEMYSDELYEYPFAYVISKYQYFIPCVVKSISNGKATLFATGEEMGGEYEVRIEELPVLSMIQIAKDLDI